MELLKPDTLYCPTQPLDWRGSPHHAFSALLGIDMATGGALAADAALSAAMQALPSGCRLDAGIPKQQAEWLLAGTVSPQTRDGSVIEIRVGKSRRRFLVLPAPDGAPVPLNWEAAAFDPEANPLGSREAPRVSDPALPHGAPACPLPLGAWPCRMRNLGTYDARWLQTRWPGLPDDADWLFFNEAQPQQRLSDGLRGDEEIFLSSFGPQLPALSFRLPGPRLQLEILRAGEEQWKGHAIQLDTLWLFPAQRTALLCWHALVPCADEAASDIAAARFVLAPAALNDGASPLSPAAAAGAAAVVGMAAAAAAAGSATSADDAAGDAGNAPPDAAPSAAAPHGAAAGAAPHAEAVAATPPSPAAADPSAAEISAALTAELESNLGDINAALVEAGLPPLSPAQMEETRRRLADLSAAAVHLREAPPPPPLEDMLRQAGLSEERLAAVNSALELEPPHAEEYGDGASWQAASEAFVDRFAQLMQPSDSLRASLSQMLRLMGPEGEQACRDLGGNPGASTSALLQQAGMSPSEADGLLDLLDNVPDDPAALSAYARRMETELGYPPGALTSHLQRYEAAFRELESHFPAANAAPAAASPTSPGDGPQAAASAASAATAAQGAAATASEPHAAPDSPDAPDAPDAEAAAPSRAALPALLAAGGTLAGLSLAGADLSGLRLDGQALAGADLRGANLRGASLVHADLRGANLTQADAAGACFLRANLSQAQLRGLRAVDADFSGADLAGADATGADFSSALFHESRAPGLKAAQAGLENARLRHSDLSGADLSAANLRGADLHALCLDKASLRGANLADAALGNGTRATGADLSQAVLTGSAWTGVAAPGAVFRQAEAGGGSFTDCDFAAADWSAARARQADFTRCSLRGASLRRADLFEASLREARLHGADAREANLYGADLYRLGLDGGSRLDGADLTHTILAARKGQC